MKKETIDLLSTFSTETLAKIACEINCWEFPVELKSLNAEIFESYDYKKITHDKILKDFFYNELSPIISFIKNKIGSKKYSHYWNTIHRKDDMKMTDEKFESWWNSKENFSK